MNRCEALTKQGGRCTRHATGGIYCTQHAKMLTNIPKTKSLSSFDVTAFPDDVQYEIYLNMDFDTLVNACEVDNTFWKLCKSEQFWNAYFALYNYPLPVDKPNSQNGWINAFILAALKKHRLPRSGIIYSVAIGTLFKSWKFNASKDNLLGQFEDNYNVDEKDPLLNEVWKSMIDYGDIEVEKVTYQNPKTGRLRNAGINHRGARDRF